MVVLGKKSDVILVAAGRFVRNNWHNLLFVLISLTLPAIWLYSEHIIVPEETWFINYDGILNSQAYAWSSNYNYGLPVLLAGHVLIMPNAAFYRALELIGLSNHQIQVAFLQCFLLLVFFSISKFLGVLTRDRRIIFVCSLAYVFNFYFSATIFYSAKMYQLILTPLLFVFIYRLLQTRDKRYAACAFVALFFLQAIFTNYPQALATLAIIPLAILYYLFEKSGPITAGIATRWKELTCLVAVMCPIIAYQLLIIWTGYLSGGTPITQQALGLQFQALTAPLNLVFQLRGSWWEFQGYEGIPYNPWLGFHEQWTTIAATFGLLVIAISAGLSKRRRNASIFFLVVYVAAVFLASGSSFSPKLFGWIFHNLLGFFIFREPWAKFMPLVLLAFTALLALAIESVKNTKVKKYACAIVIIFILTKAAPFISQNFFNHSNEGWAKSFIEPPQYWYEYGNWTKSNREKYTLPLPYGNVNLLYNWYDGNLGNANTPMYGYLGYGNLIGQQDANYGDFRRIIDIFEKENNTAFVKLGPLDYLLEQRDIDYKLAEDKLDHQMEVKQYFQKEVEIPFGNKLFLYKVNPQTSPPVVFVPKNIVALDEGTVADLPKIVSGDTYEPLTAIYFKNESTVPFSTGKIDSPAIEWHKINPTKYRVRIHGAKGTIPILLLESFHSQWKAYASTPSAGKDLPEGDLFETLFKTPLPDESHVVANGYANSWVIDCEKVCSGNENCVKNADGTYDFELVLEFWPQRLFYVVQVLMAITLLLCIVLIAYCYTRKTEEN